MKLIGGFLKILLLAVIAGFIFSLWSVHRFLKTDLQFSVINWSEFLYYKEKREDTFNYKKLGTIFGIKNNFIQEKKDFIEANLGEMVLSLYKGGEVVKTYPILVKGKESNWGETASGLFKIKRMRRVAFSNLGDVYMPWWMEFWGNYSIHGMPYYPGGEEAQRTFSSGCINLKTEDAEELYNLVGIGTSVLVLDKDFENDNFDYSFLGDVPTLPNVGAEAYLVADLKNGYVFSKKNENEILPVASVTKLVTAVTASENLVLAFDPDKTTKVLISPEMLLPIGSTPGITAGKKFTYFDLLYPLLMYSSNDAAESLAIRYGKEEFIGLMNQRVQSLSMMNTKLVDSYGYDPGNVSTASDLFSLARYLLDSRSWLLNITKGKIYEDFGEITLGNLKNFNLFYDDPSFVGGKVGATPIARKTGVFIFDLEVKGEERPVAIIILKSEDNKKDTEEILNWLRENLNN